MGTESKVMTTKEAVEKFVHEGDTIFYGGCLMRYPMSTLHEVMRQNKRHLKIWLGSEGAGFGGDMLCGEGFVDEAHYAWLGNYAARLGIGVTKGWKNGMKLFHYSNGLGAVAIMATAMGMPYAPVHGMLGSDMIKYNPDIIEGTDPFSGKKIALLKAAPKFDVAFIHCPRGDAIGNGQTWGTRGTHDYYGALAAKKVILSVEEIVPNEVICSDPDRTVVPFVKTVAVCEEPWGGHPSAVPGYYQYDVPFSVYCGVEVRKGNWDSLMHEWIYDVPDRKAYIKHYIDVFGLDALNRWRMKTHRYSTSVDYGYTSFSVMAKK